MPPEPPGELAADPVSTEEIGQARKDLSEALPADTALLKVVMTTDGDQDAYQLEGYFRQRVWVSDPTDLRYQHRPGQVLSRVLNRTASLDTVVACYQYWLNWSTGKGGLKKWIGMLRGKAGDGLRLVIWDDTDFGIPWELFRLDSASKVLPEWLGTAVQTIRWTTVHDETRSDQFSADPVQANGNGILYFEDAALEEDPKYGIAAQGHPGAVPKNGMKALLEELQYGPRRYGLVYVRAHGVHGESISQASLAGVCLKDIEGYVLSALRESRSIIFLNACNSAAPVFDEDYDKVNRNFTEIFLRQRASAVIATMAEVPVGPSSGLARTLLARARKKDVSVPWFLWRRRVAYSEHVPSQVHDPTDEQKHAIYGFMYVSMFIYFGHPESVFRLDAS